MIKIIHNNNNINDLEIDEEVVRVKAIIINNKGEVLLGYSYWEYQFLGGHVKKKEELMDALIRELKEETGLNYKNNKINLVGVREAYYNDYPVVGKNKKITIYYYEIYDDRIPDLKNTNYTKEELEGNFSLRYVPINNLKDVLEYNIANCGDSSGIQGEMIEFLEKYRGKCNE